MRRVTILFLLAWAASGCGGDKSSGGNNNDPLCECGNGVIECEEACDDGEANSDTEPDACRTNCIRAGCGDGIADTGEECDGEDLRLTICADIGYNHMLGPFQTQVRIRLHWRSSQFTPRSQNAQFTPV